jgi:hypothetical protein
VPPARGRVRTGPAPSTRPAARPAPLRVPAGTRPRGARLPRAPFILLVLALLGGGLICLLVINTTLGGASFQIDRLQNSVTARQLEVQRLEQQIAADEAPAKIAQEACLLGMRPQQQLEYLDLRSHKLIRQPAGAVIQAPQAGCDQ